MPTRREARHGPIPGLPGWFLNKVNRRACAAWMRCPAAKGHEMIEGLVAGKVYWRPERRVGNNSGRPFVTAKVRAPAGDGEAVFVNVVAFEPAAQAALLALGDGDAVTLAGAMTAKAWTDREGTARPALDLVAAQVLTTYHLRRKREAMAAAGEQRQQPARQGQQRQQDHGSGDFSSEDDAWLQGGRA